MEVVKRKTGCLCHNCDRKESNYVISSKSGTQFKVFWAREKEDCEIAFCEDCARFLLDELTKALH